MNIGFPPVRKMVAGGWKMVFYRFIWNSGGKVKKYRCLLGFWGFVFRDLVVK